MTSTKGWKTMADTPRRLTARELLRNLPDLISGSEPELGGARAAEYLRHYPEARAPLMLAGSMVGAMHGAPGRMAALLPALPRDVWQSVDKARRVLTEQLMVLLHDAALWYLDLAAKTVGNAIQALPDLSLEPPVGGRIERTRAALADEFGLSGDPNVGPEHFVRVLRLLVEPDAKGAATIAWETFSACVLEVPGHSIFRLNLIVASSLVPADPGPWLRYAREVADSVLRAAALKGAAASMAARARFREALDLAAQARVFGDRAGIAWNAVGHALLAGESRQAIRFATAFREAWEDVSVARRGEFIRLAGLVPWSIASARSPDSYARVLACLPSSVVKRMESRPS